MWMVLSSFTTLIKLKVNNTVQGCIMYQSAAATTRLHYKLFQNFGLQHLCSLTEIFVN